MTNEPTASLAKEVVLTEEALIGDQWRIEVAHFRNEGPELAEVSRLSRLVTAMRSVTPEEYLVASVPFQSKPIPGVVVLAERNLELNPSGSESSTVAIFL